MLLMNYVACSGGSDSAAPVVPSTSFSSNDIYTLQIAPATYREGETIEIHLVSITPLTVSGTPYIEFNLGGNTVQASYQSGSGSSDLLFGYTVQLGELDLDGIELSSTVNLNSGSITYDNDSETQNLDTNLNAYDTSNIFVDATNPQLQSLTPPSDSTYINNQHTDFQITFSESVYVVGLPRLHLNVGASTVYANYISGSGTSTLTFRYLPQLGEVDNDGISVASPIDLNSGSILDNAGNPAALSFIPPVLTGVLINGDNDTSITLNTPDHILVANSTAYTLTGSCSDNTQDVVVTIEATTLTPNPVCDSNTWSITSDVSAIADGPSLNINVSHDDGSGNIATTSENILKDSTAPSITNVNISDNTYGLGDSITIQVDFDDNVTIIGSPRIELSFESQSQSNIYANLVSGDGTSSLIFNYSIATGDSDSNGIGLISSIDLNAATMKDDNSNDVNLTLSTTTFTNVYVDTQSPYITSFVEPANGTYTENGELLFQVNFSEAVTITGTPRIILNIGGVTRYADYDSGSGTTGLEFKYIVQTTDDDNDGIAIISSSIDLNTGSILATSDNDIAALSFSLYQDSTAGVLIDNSSGITPPDQVNGVTTAPTTSGTTLNISWAVPNDNGTSIINYIVQYREQGTSTWMNASTPSSNSTSINGLSSGVTYEIRVAANNGLIGAYSSVSTVEIFDIMSLNPIAWLSSTDITDGGAEPIHGDKIATWKDLTGTATDATEANPTKQPTYHTNVQNGLPAIYFDGTLDRGLQGGFTRTTNNGLTMILVGRFNGTARRAFFEFHQTGGGTSPGDPRGFFFTYGFNNASVNYNLNNTQFNIWDAYDTGTQTNFYENGNTIYTNFSNWGNTAFTGSGSYVLGDDQTGGDRLDGYIGELLIFDGPLTNNQLTTLRSYLKNKWGTP